MVIKGIHWTMAWDRLCVLKKYGGLGFKDLCAFNLAMLRKKLDISSQSLVYKVRYIPSSSFIDVTLDSCPSFCWISIMAAHGLIYNGVRRKIGNGAFTLVWGHPWLLDDSNPMIQTVMAHHLCNSRVLRFN